MTEKEMLFRTAGNEQAFDLRSKVGGWWSKATRDPQFAARYKDLGRNYQAQRRFRAAWASEQADVLTNERLQSQANIEVDEQAGSYEA
eukprot:14228630-Alexandrium_andersonii.AAC.1